MQSSLEEGLTPEELQWVLIFALPVLWYVFFGGKKVEDNEDEH